MAAVTTAVIAGAGAVAGAYGARQQRKSAEEQARAASKPTSFERTTTQDPWAPSVDYRTLGMERAAGLLGKTGAGGRGSTYSPTGYSAKTYSAREAGESPYALESADFWRKFAAGEGGSPYTGEAGDYWRRFAEGEGDPRLNQYLDQLIPGEGKQYTGNPFMDQMVEASLRGTDERYKQGLAGLALGAETTGRYGGGAHQLASAKAATDFANVLSDTEAGLRFEDYNARMSEIPGLLGLSQQGRLAGASGLTDLAGLDQQLRLAGAGGLTELSSQDLQRIMFNIEAQNSAAARNAAAKNAAAAHGASARNAAAQYNAGAGWRDLGAYSDIVNAMSRGYGTTTEKGTQQGPQVAPAPTPSPWMAGIQGGLSGWQLGSGLTGSFGKPSYTANPTAQQAARNAAYGWS